MASIDLQLYSKYAEGMRYLLAQSPDTRDLVPEVEEGKWERIGKKRGVEVISVLADDRRAQVHSAWLPWVAFIRTQECSPESLRKCSKLQGPELSTPFEMLGFSETDHLHLGLAPVPVPSGEGLDGGIPILQSTNLPVSLDCADV